MAVYDESWVAAEEAKRQYMNEHSLYRAEDEHASCGVGLVVSVSGKPSRKVVQNGIDALKAVWHRGAVDADGKTGDGAGIHVQIPTPFFYDQIRRTGHEPDMSKLVAVGQVFLPRTDFGAQERCRTIVETEVLRMGHYIYGWRHVPVNIDVLGDKANATRPEIEQILIRCDKDVDEETFERELYIIRRRIEKAAADVVVLDHHLGGETLPPALAVVNPNRQDESGDLGHLCAAGVVFL
ncbi:glutamate synthase large subunit, partial [Thioclava sp. BHET1]